MCFPPSVNKESLFLKSILEVSFFYRKKKKFIKEIKLKAVNDYLNGNKSTVKIALIYNVINQMFNPGTWI